MEIADTYEFLLGDWTLTRWIEDRRTGLSGRFIGRATLVETTGGCGWYTEEGELSYKGYAGPANRMLQVLRQSDGTAVLHFSDGRPYVVVDLSTANWSGRHLCWRDTYEIDMQARSESVVLEQWRVRGPAKCYDALAFLYRAESRVEIPSQIRTKQIDIGH